MNGDGSGSGGSEDSWSEVKASASVNVVLSGEFGTASSLPIATLGWEDGLNVSRNGLNLYATYIPADFLSFVLAGGTPAELPDYARGPSYDMDFTTNPTGESYSWLHSDIIYASRASAGSDFSSWDTSAMKRSVYSEGAVTTVFSNDSTIEMLAFTSNEEYTAQNNIKILTGTPPDPSGTGSIITATDTSGTTQINTNYIEDNPHLEHLSGNSWVLFFDSEDRPVGEGSHDLWYALSSDGGSSWSTPVNVSSINTADKEHQPHLYHDGTDWWLYYSRYHSDGKLAIYRARQGTADDWDSWGTPEAVISSGNTAGVGEPTLTDNGDLFFTVILENPEGTDRNRYDADPWTAPAI